MGTVLFLVIAFLLFILAVWLARKGAKNVICPHCKHWTVKQTGRIWRCERCGKVKQRQCHIDKCATMMKQNDKGIWVCPKCQATSEGKIAGQ